MREVEWGLRSHVVIIVSNCSVDMIGQIVKGKIWSIWNVQRCTRCIHASDSITTNVFAAGVRWWDRIHSGHVFWRLPGHLRYFHRFSNAFWINIQLFRYSLVYFDFSTYRQYHMLIAQPLRPITNRIAACFTFIPSFLPSAYHITGDWGIFTYITWPYTIIVMHY